MTQLNFRIDSSFGRLAPPIHPLKHTHTHTHTTPPNNQVINSFTMDRKFQLPARSIPERSSSRSPKKGDSFSLKRIRDWENKRRDCNAEAKKQRKNLKLGSSFDTAYWTARRDIAEKQIQATVLIKKISIASMKGNEEDNTRAFLESEDGQKLILQERSLSLDRKLYEAQAEKMKSKDEKFNFRRSFLQLFIGSETGLGIRNSRGRRDATEQSDFRQDLRLKMGSDHPDPLRELFWCPVTRDYWDKVTAGHFFPWKSGEATMEAIFGRSESGESEMFKAENGILWSECAEERFEGGHFVIVPDIVDQPTQEQVDTWEASDPKEYKIKVLNPNHSKMQMKIGNTDKTWADLDNDRLQFMTNFRPRARYLYFAYCAAMLRRSHAGNHLEVSSAEPGKRFWGTPGRYMLEGMLLGFVEEMGHQYKHLLEGAIKEDEAVADPTAIAAANTHVQETLKSDNEENPDDSDDDSDNDDEGKAAL